MSSVFSKIISGEIPCYKIAEDDKFLAFLDIFPLVEGHILVIPKTEVDKVYELPEDIQREMLPFASKIAKALEKCFDCQRVGMGVIGLEVPHAHLHLMPINQVSDLDFSKPKLKLSKERLEEIAKIIRSYLE